MKLGEITKTTLLVARDLIPRWNVAVCMLAMHHGMPGQITFVHYEYAVHVAETGRESQAHCGGRLGSGQPPQLPGRSQYGLNVATSPPLRSRAHASCRSRVGVFVRRSAYECVRVKAASHERCLLRMSHVAWSVCMCVSACWATGELCKKNDWTDRDAICGLTHVSRRNHVLDGGPDLPMGWGTFDGGHVPAHMVTYLPPANVSAQRTRQTNAYVTARSDKTVM